LVRINILRNCRNGNKFGNAQKQSKAHILFVK
jgi:hypothetical protein